MNDSEFEKNKILINKKTMGRKLIVFSIFSKHLPYLYDTIVTNKHKLKEVEQEKVY